MDKYDEAIQYLKNHPEEVSTAWGDPTDHPAGCLFNYAGPEYSLVGCLTQVKNGYLQASTPSLTKRIRADKRIPRNSLDITIDILPVFAEWQRKLDKYKFRKEVS